MHSLSYFGQLFDYFTTLDEPLKLCKVDEICQYECELRRIVRDMEVVVTYLTYYNNIRLEGLRKTMKTLTIIASSRPRFELSTS